VNLPLVTIVTPSYNQGRFIRATIESVLSQDYPRIEYIIMDGGSTDETAGIASEYAGRLLWFSEKDRGQSHAINKGFRMAKGEIVSWLNSDDVILPGAVAHAVRAFQRNAQLGAVYGEGYQIDVNGNVKTRFPYTEPFNLWKLVYLWDYILQQTAYFRRSVFDEIGFLDESLNWGMDWDIFIRIGKRYPIEYIPEYMGSIREYDDAKSFAGGGKRFRELTQLMRRHGSRRYPPGYITYGLDTYSSMWCKRLQAWTPRWLEGPSRRVQRVLRGAAGAIVDRTAGTAQGLYADGWAAPELNYMLRPGSGAAVLAGSLPDFGEAMREQRLKITCNGVVVAQAEFPCGEFQIRFEVPPQLASGTVTFRIGAANWIVPSRIGLSKDSRRLAYMVKSFGWVREESHPSDTPAVSDSAGAEARSDRIEIAPGVSDSRS